MTTIKKPDPTTKSGFEQTCQALEDLAQEYGLDWRLGNDSAPSEPPAFRLVRENGKPIRPSLVIGETEEQARACIDAAALKRNE
jgi:hypothetical protein